MISSHSCSEPDANTRQSNVFPSGLSGDELNVETRIRAHQDSVGRDQAPAPGIARAATQQAQHCVSRTHIPLLGQDAHSQPHCTSRVLAKALPYWN